MGKLFVSLLNGNADVLILSALPTGLKYRKDFLQRERINSLKLYVQSISYLSPIAVLGYGCFYDNSCCVPSDLT